MVFALVLRNPPTTGTSPWVFAWGLTVTPPASGLLYFILIREIGGGGYFFSMVKGQGIP